MKKLLSNTMFLFFIICGFVSASGMGNNESFPIISEVPSTKKLKLSTTGFKSEEIKCNILMENGTILHSQLINTTIVNTTLFDLSNLDRGSYIIEVEDGLRFQEFKVDVYETDLKVSSDLSITYKPHLSFEGGKHLNVNLFCGGKKAVVKILDEEGVIYRESITKTPTVSKRYDFSHLPRGKYFIEISIGSKYMRQSIFK